VSDTYKMAKINVITSRTVDIILNCIISAAFDAMKLILLFYMCHLRWALCIVIKRPFFTFITVNIPVGLQSYSLSI